MAVVTSLDRALSQANEIRHKLTGHHANIGDARLLATNLYRDGLKIASEELNGKSEAVQYYTPVVEALHQTVCLSGFQHDVPLHKALSKAFRIFAELTMRRCFKNQTPLNPVTRTSLLQNCDNILSTLCFTNMIRARFEYKCARQSVKMIEGTSVYWVKYIVIGAKLVGSAYTFSVGDVISHLTTLKEACVNDWVKDWYLQVLVLRENLAKVVTEKDYYELIANQIPELSMQDGKVALAMVTTLKDLIKNQTRVDSTIKNKALAQLPDLLTLEEPNSIKKFVMENVPTDKAKKIAIKQLDRFLKARLLTIHYLVKMLKKSEYKDHHEKYKEALKSYQERQAARYEQKEKEIQSLYSVVRAKQADSDHKAYKIRQQFEKFMESSRLPLKTGIVPNKDVLCCDVQRTTLGEIMDEEFTLEKADSELKSIKKEDEDLAVKFEHIQSIKDKLAKIKKLEEKALQEE